jgi:hypothetical protein
MSNVTQSGGPAERRASAWPMAHLGAIAAAGGGLGGALSHALVGFLAMLVHDLRVRGKRRAPGGLAGGLPCAPVSRYLGDATLNMYPLLCYE